MLRSACRRGRGLLRDGLERTKLLTEPAGAAGVASLLSGRVDLEDGPVVVVLSGGNADLEMLGRLLRDG